MSASASLQAKAAALVDELVARGATFEFRPAHASLPRSFIYGVPRGSDRWHCRSVITAAKADAGLWSAVLDEVEARCGGGHD